MSDIPKCVTLNTAMHTEITDNTLQKTNADSRLGLHSWSSVSPFGFGKHLNNELGESHQREKQHVAFIEPIFKWGHFPTLPELHSDTGANSGRNPELHNSPTTVWAKKHYRRLKFVSMLLSKTNWQLLNASVRSISLLWNSDHQKCSVTF